MYNLHPPHIFVHERVYRNPKAVARMERMLAALENPPPVEVVSSDETDRIMEAAGVDDGILTVSARNRQGVARDEADPVILFNTFAWDEADRVPAQTSQTNFCARRIAHLMGGDLSYRRREGWTIFDLVLPALTVDPAEQSLAASIGQTT